MGRASCGAACLAMTVVTFIAGASARADGVRASDDEEWTPPKRHGKPVLSAVELGLTVGLSVPFGSAIGASPQSGNRGQDLSEIFTFGAPFGIEGGYLRGHWLVGISGAYASLLRKEGVASCFGACNSHSFELGAWVAYHGSPKGGSDPWVALGTGLEWTTATTPGIPANIDTTFDGFQFVQARIGLMLERDLLQRAAFFGVGPFVGLSVGQYVHMSTSDGVLGTNTSMDIDNKGFHEWLTVGLRLSYDIVFKNEDHE